MNQKRLLALSLAFNLVLIPAGTIYLIRKVKFWTQYAETHQPVQSVPQATPDDFLETLDYQWQKQLFEEEPIQNGAVVFVGDSITASGLWQHVWQRKLREPILNRGLNGDTMDGVIARIDEVLRHHPRKIFIMIGINDLRTQHRRPDDLVGQYEVLLHKINQESPDAQVYLQSLLPVWGETNKAVKEVNRQLSEMADGRKVHYVDIYFLMTDSEGQLRKDWTFDGVHLRAIGYQMWREFLWPLVCTSPTDPSHGSAR